MVETVFQFQHESGKINDALGLSYEQDIKCREVVFFSAISNHFIGMELFDNEDEKPRSLSTLTGDLEKALSLLDSDIEKYYMLLLFRNTHTLALEVIAKFNLMNKIGDSEKKKLKLMLDLLEVKLEEKKQEEEDFDFFSPTEMFKKIEYVQQSRYNFNKYLELVTNDQKS